jgi:hemerythrin-like domain-containing protein
MRADARRLAVAVAAIGELDRTDRAQALARWYAGYHGELHDHHVIEDEIFYPALVERLPEVKRLIARVDADHEYLSDLLGRVGVVLERLANPHVPFRFAHAEAVRLTEGLHALLESHLSFEDDDIVPLFAEHFTGAEYEVLEKQASKRVNLRQLAFTIPWALEGADAEQRRHLLSTVPHVFKLVWYVTRGRYRRMAAGALDVAAAEPAMA